MRRPCCPNARGRVNQFRCRRSALYADPASSVRLGPCKKPSRPARRRRSRWPFPPNLEAQRVTPYLGFLFLLLSTATLFDGFDAAMFALRDAGRAGHARDQRQPVGRHRLPDTARCTRLVLLRVLRGPHRPALGRDGHDRRLHPRELRHRVRHHHDAVRPVSVRRAAVSHRRALARDHHGRRGVPDAAARPRDRDPHQPRDHRRHAHGEGAAVRAAAAGRREQRDPRPGTHGIVSATQTALGAHAGRRRAGARCTRSACCRSGDPVPAPRHARDAPLRGHARARSDAPKRTWGDLLQRGHDCPGARSTGAGPRSSPCSGTASTS